MPLSEFSLIARFFAQTPPRNSAVRLGIGDDCALLAVPAGHELAVTTDTMVEDVHFFAGADPRGLGHKLLAVNLSDLAAMGARPLAATLALTLPKADEDWLAAFSQGFGHLAQAHGVDLIGGDTTRGPLTLTAQALGLVPAGAALRRDGAQAGDHIYLSGPIGDAGLGLKICQGLRHPRPEAALSRLHRPSPRVELGLALRGLATACIDLSDGLAGDLGHILHQSGKGARLRWEALPLSAQVMRYIDDSGDWLMPLVAGDDYELCFTVNPADAHRLPGGCSQIGVIEPEPGLRLDKAGQCLTVASKSHEHFC